MVAEEAGVDGVGIDPFSASPADVLSMAETLAPGPYLMSLLLMIDRSALSADDAVTYLQLHDRVTSWWASLQPEALVAAAGPSVVVQEYLAVLGDAMTEQERTIRIADAAREEVAAAMRWPVPSAQRRIDHARLLVGPLSATRDALEAGDISSAHVQVVCDAAERLSTSDDPQAFSQDCAALQRRVLPVARRAPVSNTRRCANRAVEAIDASGQAKRRRRARCSRDVYLTQEEDGLSTIVARLDAMTARSIMAAVRAASGDARIPGECGATAGERRVEAFAALVLGIPRDDASDASPGQGVTDAVVVSLDVSVDVTLPLEALAALGQSDADQPGADQPGADQPGAGQSGAIQLDGSVLDLADVARMLDDPAVRAHLRPVIVESGASKDSASHVLDVGRRRYEVAGALRRLIVARDGMCRFPGCSRAAYRCQIDHATAWCDGGCSDVDNLGPLCLRHHQCKTHGGWEIIESSADGSCVWRSPTGRLYRHVPEGWP